MGKIVSTVSTGGEDAAAGLAAALVASGGDGGLPPAVLELIAQLAMTAKRREAREIASDEDVRLKELIEKERKASLKADVRESVERGRREQAAEQQACSHRQDPPVNKTNVIGSRFISGNLYLQCQACLRNFPTQADRDWLNRNGLMPPAGSVAAAPTAV